MSSLTCLGHGGGIFPISKHLGLSATCLGRTSASSKVGHLFRLSMVFPNLTPNLSTSFISLVLQVFSCKPCRTHIGRKANYKQGCHTTCNQNMFPLQVLHIHLQDTRPHMFSYFVACCIYKFWSCGMDLQKPTHEHAIIENTTTKSQLHFAIL